MGGSLLEADLTARLAMIITVIPQVVHIFTACGVLSISRNTRGYALMDWNRFKSFYYVVNDGTFTAASSRLHLTQSSVSRQVQTLEKELKLKLFTRKNRKIHLTKEGKVYFEAVESMIRESNNAANTILDLQKDPRGLVRIASNDGVCNRFLLKYIRDFTDQFPHLRLRIVNSDAAGQFPTIGCDAAILPASTSPVDYIRKYLTSMHLGLFASSQYLDEKGVPKSPDELDNHRLISYGTHAHAFPEIDWGLSVGLTDRAKPRKPYIQVNMAESLPHLALDGLGIVTLEKRFGRQLGLVQLLPRISSPSIDLFFVYPPYLKQCRKIHVVGRFLREVAIREYGK